MKIDTFTLLIEINRLEGDESDELAKIMHDTSAVDRYKSRCQNRRDLVIAIESLSELVMEKNILNAIEFDI